MQKIRIALAAIAVTGATAPVEAAQYTATASVSEQVAPNPGYYNIVQKQLLAKRAAIVKAEKMASEDTGKETIQVKIIDTHLDGDIYYVTIEA